jgi:hypothetical protein
MAETIKCEVKQSAATFPNTFDVVISIYAAKVLLSIEDAKRLRHHLDAAIEGAELATANHERAMKKEGV